MKPPTKITSVTVAAAVAAAGLLIAPHTASAGDSDAARTVTRPGAPGEPKLVKLRATEKNVKISDAKFRPGVTEFRVVKTALNRSSLFVVKTDNLERAFKLADKAFSGGPGSADAMKKFDNLITAYSGGAEGARWQAKLGKGQYYVLDTKTNAVAPFKVKGERRDVKMRKATSEITTTKDNQFTTSGKLAGKWIKFTNNSREIHFVEADHVKNSTTGKDVRKALTSNGEPKWMLKGGFFFEIQSPGVTTVHRQEVKPDARYLLICFMPSEEHDGMPHAFMGMWKLVNSV